MVYLLHRGKAGAITFVDYSTIALAESFENLLCFLIGKTRKLIVRRLNDELSARKLPITFDQFVFLYKLSIQTEPASQQTMAALTGKDKSAILRTVGILEKKGLVSRTQDSLDKRKNILAITPACNELFNRVLALFDEVNQELKSGITAESYEVLAHSLLQIQQNAEQTK